MGRRAAAYSRPGREDMMKEPRYNICCPWDTQEAAQATKQREYDGRMRILSRELFYLWNFILQQELWDEARDFLDEYMGDPAPFEFDW